MSGRILVVEDDEDLARGLRFNLEHEGYAVEHAATGAAALAALQEPAAEGRAPIELVVLDLGLPDVDGLEILRRLRAGGRTTPGVMCLTARGQETDIVMGLGLGADDYVTKPFGLAELLARVQSVLRRARAARAGDGSGAEASGAELHALGEVVVDLTAHRARHPDRDEELTPIEVELLRYLLAHRGQALERSRILEDLWGLGRGAATRTLDNHVARLRRKIERDSGEPRWLVTVHGVGYRLESE